MPQPRSETTLVEREVRVEADPEVVFPFFTEPEKMARWLGSSAVLDPRPGGVFSVNSGIDFYLAGEYLVVEPHSRVVFTWGFGNFPEADNLLPAGASTVEVELVPDGEATLVRLTHRVPTELADFHSMGWEHYLGRLAIAAPGGDPGPDPFAGAGKLLSPNE